MLFGMLACAGEGADAPRSAISVTDSSGVRITISPDTETRYAVVDSQPMLSIGGPDEQDTSQFFNIQGIDVDSSGNIWIANRGTNEVRIFRSDGTPWKTFGRGGGGPGEFRRVRLLGIFQENRVAVWDDGNPRLTVLTAAGELESLVPINVEGTTLNAVRVFPDGSLLVRVPQVYAAQAIEGKVIPDTSSLLRYDLARDTLTAVGTLSGPLWLWTGQAQVPIAFTINAAYALDDAQAVHIADEPEFRIRVLKDGTHLETYGVDRQPRTVIAEHRAAYRDFYQSNMPDGPVLRAYLSSLDHPSVPARLPAYSQILIDDRGNTWAQIYSPNLLDAPSWDVYGSDQARLGTVKTPAGLIVNVISGDTVVGVWRDDLGVEHVRSYRFVVRNTPALGP
jgi:hypothetical protein